MLHLLKNCLAEANKDFRIMTQDRKSLVHGSNYSLTRTISRFEIILEIGGFIKELNDDASV